ncbi:hypothetical protein O181_067002 [Austropuccinia psidii MF-1]|uniref:Uncharacterized protein n=1 Tax=Austropuccinia psidii MF-1 TaxID=1389203 RepID=A0A9Q3EWH8_9BASI|nr:hypothetical protein [Austropuccinia psidii MF-1]
MKWSFQHSNISSHHQGTQSFRGLTEAQEQVFQHQRPITPSRRHWIISFTVFLQGNTVPPFSRDSRESSFIHSIVKCQSSAQSVLATTFISIQSGSIKNCISFSSMGNSINPIQFQY